MTKKKWGVRIPITGFVYVEIEADTKEAAIEEAFEHMSDEDAQLEWEGHDTVCEGNVFHGMLNEADASEIKS